MPIALAKGGELLFSLIKSFSVMFLSACILVCGTPRCGYIITMLNQLTVETQNMSCHASEELDRQAQISDTRSCECELLSFVSIAAPPPIRSLSQVIFVDQKLLATRYLMSVLSIWLSYTGPPPR